MDFSMLRPLAGGALGLWFALSVLAQARPAPLRRLLRFDALNLVTRYSFFGPDPRLEDTRVVSRRLAADGTSSEWQPVWNYQSRTLLGALWNPRRRADYGFAKDCWRVAAASRRGVAPGDLETSPPFQRVLNVVRHRTFGPGGAGLFEFHVAIVRFGTDASDTEDIVLRSGPRGA